MNKKLRTIDLTLASMFVALIAVGANITSIIPFFVVGGVPITLQSFFAILAGIILGSRLGAISTMVYTFVGLVGVPVFAQFSGGIGMLIKPTFGFILAFILSAYIAGKIVEKYKTVSGFIIASLIATAIDYIIGTNWMYFSYKLWADAPDGFTYSMAWMWMLVPLPKDIILAVVAGLMAHRLEKTVLSKDRFKHLKLGA